MSQVELVGRDTGLVGYNALAVTANGHMSSLPNVKYNATEFTLANGAQTEFQCNEHGALKVTQEPNSSIISYQHTLSTGQDSIVFDLRGCERVRIWGNFSINVVVYLQYSAENPYSWKFVDTLQPIAQGGFIFVNKLIEAPPPYIRIANTSGQSVDFGLRILKIS